MAATSRGRTAGALALGLALLAAGCGQSQTDEAAIDKELLDDAQDPAMTGALEDQILVDPDLARQDRSQALLSDGAASDGRVPADTGMAGGRAAAEAAASREIGEGRMLSAPAPTVVAAEDCRDCREAGMTMADRAAMQSGGRGKGSCDDRLTYSFAWADRMPPDFPVYPRGRVKEAAGVENGLCDIRVAHFTTDVGLKQVVDYYYTRARRAGYTAEYQLRGGEHVLGGVRDVDDGAYVLFVRERADGSTEAELVASNGR